MKETNKNHIGLEKEKKIDHCCFALFAAVVVVVSLVITNA
jgi:hypothetical protein